jgi:hypothetical protein
MNKLALFASLILATAVAVEAKQSTLHGRDLTPVSQTESVSPDSAANLVLSQLKQAGWHDVIYSSISTDRAFVYYTQRRMSGTKISGVKLTLWKALKEAGETRSTTWTVNLEPNEVNAFLDEEFPRLANQFKIAK